MNVHDSDSMKQILLGGGYRYTETMDDAQIILVNTCAVRKKAEEKALAFVGRLASLKKKQPELITGITGCIAQSRGAKLLKQFSFLDLVVGPRNISSIEQFLTQIKEDRERITALDLKNIPQSFCNFNGYLNGKVKCFLKIMEGCDNFCSYCVVPHVRGREISLSAEQIIDQAYRFVNQGIKEITLIGQNVNSYNVKDNAPPTFPGLLRQLDRIPGLERLRFTTSHPKDLSDELIGLFGELKSLCPHIHLPFQSGSNKVLDLMNRGYTSDRYKSLIEGLRKTRPDIAITSDVIVGFPGETVRDFEDSLRLIEDIGFDNLYSFKYSERPRTKALTLPGKIEEKEKQRRLSLLQEKQKKITLRKNVCLEGTVHEVLIEGPGKRGSNQLTGRTPGNKAVNFSSQIHGKGEIVPVRIVRGFQNSLRGELFDG